MDVDVDCTGNSSTGKGKDLAAPTNAAMVISAAHRGDYPVALQASNCAYVWHKSNFGRFVQALGARRMNCAWFFFLIGRWLSHLSLFVSLLSHVLWFRPLLCLPVDKAAVGGRCCPRVFQRRTACPTSSLGAELAESEIGWPSWLPYRMIFALFSLTSIFLYDTESEYPIAFISNLHYSSLSDLTWFPDGRGIVVSSTDGYCSTVTFAEGELGIPLSDERACGAEWFFFFCSLLCSAQLLFLCCILGGLLQSSKSCPSSRQSTR